MFYIFLKVQVNCIPPMCELLTVMDTKIIQVALNGLDNILKAGDQINVKLNPYGVLIAECHGKFKKKNKIYVN